MTTLGLSYLNYEETKRSNLAKEAETARANLVNEQRNRESLEETIRSNLAQEQNVRRGQDISARTTERGQDINAETTRRGQDVNAQVTTRGQDINAATTQRGQDINAETTRRGQDIGAQTTTRGQDLSYEISKAANAINERRVKADVLTDMTDKLYKVHPIAGLVSIFNTWETLFPDTTLVNFKDEDLWQQLYKATEGTSLNKVVEAGDKLFHKTDDRLGKLFDFGNSLANSTGVDETLDGLGQFIGSAGKLVDSISEYWKKAVSDGWEGINNFFGDIVNNIGSGLESIKPWIEKIKSNLEIKAVAPINRFNRNEAVAN